MLNAFYGEATKKPRKERSVAALSSPVRDSTVLAICSAGLVDARICNIIDLGSCPSIESSRPNFQSIDIRFIIFELYFGKFRTVEYLYSEPSIIIKPVSFKTEI